MFDDRTVVVLWCKIYSSVFIGYLFCRASIRTRIQVPLLVIHSFLCDSPRFNENAFGPLVDLLLTVFGPPARGLSVSVVDVVANVAVVV